MLNFKMTGNLKMSVSDKSGKSSVCGCKTDIKDCIYYMSIIMTSFIRAVHDETQTEKRNLRGFFLQTRSPRPPHPPFPIIMDHSTELPMDQSIWCKGGVGVVRVNVSAHGYIESVLLFQIC